MPLVSKKKILFFTSVLLFFHICSLNALPSVFVVGNVINILNGPRTVYVNDSKRLCIAGNIAQTDIRAQFIVARVEGSFVWLRSAKYPNEFIRHTPKGTLPFDARGMPEFSLSSLSPNLGYESGGAWERLKIDNDSAIMTTRWDGSLDYVNAPGGYVRADNDTTLSEQFLTTKHPTQTSYALIGSAYAFQFVAKPAPVFVPEPKPTAASLSDKVSGMIVGIKRTDYNTFLSTDSSNWLCTAGITDSTQAAVRFQFIVNVDSTVSFKGANGYLAAIPEGGKDGYSAWTIVSYATTISDFAKFILSTDGKLYNIGMGAYISNPAGTDIRTHRPILSTDLPNKYFIARSANALGLSIEKLTPKSGTGAVWATLADGRVLFRENVTASASGGTGWAVVGGTLAKIAMGWDSNVYGVQTGGQVWKRTNVTTSSLSGTDWAQFPGVSAVSFVPGASGSGWYLNSSGSLYYTQSLSSPAWGLIDGVTLAQISAGPHGHLFALDKTGKVLYRTGISSSNLKGTDWYTMPNTNFAFIAAGPNGYAWALKSDQTVWFLKDSNATWEILENGNCRGTSISVAADGSMWLSQASGDVWMRGGITKDVPKGTFFSKVSNGTDFNVVSIAVGPVASITPAPTIATTVAPTPTTAVATGAVYVTLSDFSLLSRNGITATQPNGTGWSKVVNAGPAKIAIGSDFTAYEIGAAGAAYMLSGLSITGVNNWQNFTGVNAACMTAGPGTLWHSTPAYLAYFGAPPSAMLSGGWTQFNDSVSAIAQISAGPNGHVWGLDTSGNVLYRIGVSPSKLMGTDWYTMPSGAPGPFACIAAGPNGCAWAMKDTVAGSIYFLSNINATWTQVDTTSYGKYISVSADGQQVWLAQASGDVLMRAGITSSNPMGTAWTRVSPSSALFSETGIINSGQTITSIAVGPIASITTNPTIATTVAPTTTSAPALVPAPTAVVPPEVATGKNVVIALTADSSYLSATITGDGAGGGAWSLAATGTKATSASGVIFVVTVNSDNSLSFKAGIGKYLSALDNWTVVAQADSIGDREKFIYTGNTLYNVGMSAYISKPWPVGMRTHQNGQLAPWVKAQAADAVALKIVVLGELPAEGSLVAIKCIDPTCVSNGFYVYAGGERDSGTLSVLTTIGTTSTDPKAQFIIKNVNKTDGSFRLVSSTGWYVQSGVCNIFANKDAKADAADTKLYYDGISISGEINPSDAINIGLLNATTGDSFAPLEWSAGKKTYWSVLWDWHSLRNIKYVGANAWGGALWYPATVNEAKNFIFEVVVSAEAKAAADAKILADKALADKALADKALADKALADKALADAAAAEAKAAADAKILADKALADKALADAAAAAAKAAADAKALADKAAADKAFSDAVAKAIADKAAADKAAADKVLADKAIADAAAAAAAAKAAADAIIVNPTLDKILSVGNKITIKCDASSKYVSLGGEGTEQDPWLTIMGIDPQDPACIWEVVKRQDNAFWLKSTKTGALVITLPSTDTASPFIVKTMPTVIPDDQSKCELIENKYIQSYGPSFWNWFAPNYVRIAGSKPVNNVWSYATKTDADSFTFALAPVPFVPPTEATVVFHPRISPYNIFAFSDSWKTNNPGYIEAIFSIAAKQNAIIILSSQKNQIDGENAIRMITVGANNNSNIIIRCGGISVRGKAIVPLSGGSMLAGEQQYIDFWLSYDTKTGLLNLGKGSAVNQNVLASWQDANPIPISYIGFGGLISSSGSPVYYKQIAVTTPVIQQDVTPSQAPTTPQDVTPLQDTITQQNLPLLQSPAAQETQGVQQTGVQTQSVTQTPDVPIVQMILAKPILIPSSIPLADASTIIITDKNNKLLKVGAEGAWCTFTGKDSFDPLCRFVVTKTDAPYFIIKNNKFFLESIITTGDVAVGLRTSKNPLSDACWLKRVGSSFIKSFKDEKDTRYYWKSVANMLQTTNLEKQPASFTDADAFTISLAPPLPEANQTVLDKLKKGSVITISYSNKLLKIGGEEKNIAAFVGTDVYDPACRFDVVKQEGSYFWLSNNNVLVEVTSATTVPAFVIRTNMSAAIDESTRFELVGNSNISTGNGFWNMRLGTAKDTSRVRTNDESLLPATITVADQFVIAHAPAFPGADQTILADMKKGAIVTIANKNNKYLSVSRTEVSFTGVDPKNKACQFTIADAHDDVFRLTHNSVPLETNQFSFVLNPKASIENCWLTLVGRSYIKSFEYKKDQRYFWRSSGDVLTMGNAAMTDPATFSEAEELKITVVQKAPVRRVKDPVPVALVGSVSDGAKNVQVGNTIAILCVDSGKYLMVGGLDTDSLRVTTLGQSKNDKAVQFNIIKKEGDLIWLQSVSTGLLLKSFPAVIKVDQAATINDKDASFQIVDEKYIKGFLNLAGSYYEAFLNWRSDQELVNFANNTNPDGTYPPATIQDADKFSIELVTDVPEQPLALDRIVSFKHEKTGKYMKAAGLDADPTVVTLLGITKDDPDCRFKIVKKDGDLIWLQSMSKGVLVRSLPTVIKIDPTATINDKDAAFSFVDGKNIKGFLNLAGAFYDAFLRVKDPSLLVNYSNTPNPDGSLSPATAQDADVFIIE